MLFLIIYVFISFIFQDSVLLAALLSPSVDLALNRPLQALFKSVLDTICDQYLDVSWV